MRTGPTVVSLPESNELKASSEKLRRALPDLIENLELVAQYKRAYFDALVKQGFSEVQALDLCKHSATF